jgi:hypothetical protein
MLKTAEALCLFGRSEICNHGGRIKAEHFGSIFFRNSVPEFIREKLYIDVI